ncbi:MAG: 30S ribosomal protein S9, partial [Alphaproteobacteria bacterium]|nr:30S ribosomal protein S9 [Alphaproteobacteria bacterium]
MADEKNETAASETPAPKPEPIRDLADLGAATQAAAAAAAGTTVVAPVTPEPAAVDVAPKIDAQGRSYATGKRKNA